MRPDRSLAGAIREQIEATEGNLVVDLHLWRVGQGHNAAIVSLVSDHLRHPPAIRERLIGLHGLSHVTAEVEACPGEHG
jgi:Co/Zn/Cd efflux system component